MKSFLVLFVCLCSVSSFRIFPLAFQPTTEVVLITPKVKTQSTTKVFTNIPTSSEAPSTKKALESTASSDPATILPNPVDLAPVSKKSTDSFKDSIGSADAAPVFQNSLDTTTAISVEAVNSTKPDFFVAKKNPSASESTGLEKKTTPSSTTLSVQPTELLKLAMEKTTMAELLSTSTSPVQIASTTDSVDPTSATTTTAATTSTLADSVSTIKSSEALSDSTVSAETTTSRVATTTSVDAVSNTTRPVASKPTDAALTTTSPEASSSTTNTVSTKSRPVADSSPRDADDVSRSLKAVSATSNLLESTTASTLEFDKTTAELNFLSQDLLPPKTEYGRNEPDPRYDVILERLQLKTDFLNQSA